MNANLTQASKTISYALRHKPEEFGLKLDSEGWVEVNSLISALAAHKPPLTVSQETIERIIAESEKKRFEISGSRIRATYGHSVDAKIEFKETTPPAILYHGTSQRAFLKIKGGDGIKPMSRQYVHLSSDFNTAVAVGKRHDRTPVVLSVDSARMASDGFRFFHSANDGTWMCDNVPTKYICCVEYTERSEIV